MKKLLFVVVVGAVAALCVSVGLRVKRGSNNPAAMPRSGFEVSVEVAKVERGPIRQTIRYVGSVEAYESVTILPKVTGILETLKVQIGDRVSKGDLLATIDDAEFVQRLERAKANLKLAEARLERSRISLRSAEREFARAETMSRQGLAPDQQLDLATSDRDAAHADVDLAEADVAGARASLDEAQINLEHTRIIARLSGYIDKRRVDPGALVSATTPLCTIVRTDPAKAVIDVPETDIALIEVGRPAVVMVADGSIKLQGRVERIAPTVDVATRTTMVEIVVPNEAGELRPGMYADVTLVAEEKSDVVLAPEMALVRRNGRTEVLRVVDGVAHSTEVTLGILSEGAAEVLDGLAEGDLVIVRGQYLVGDGDRVRHETPGEQAAEAA